MSDAAACPFLPHTPGDVRAMLQRIGVEDIDALYADVPAALRLPLEALDLPSACCEAEVVERMEALASQNARLKVFVGYGAYDHYTPAVIPALLGRGELLTAYTPYQSEVSQGTLRAVFEFQSMVCALTGMDVANASLYDGPTAAAEAMMMAASLGGKADGKGRVLVAETLLPQVREVMRTYAKFHGVALSPLPQAEGQTDREALREALAAGDVAGAVVPLVNRFGIVEDLTGFADALHAERALLVAYCDPSTLSVVKSPAAWGADIAVGEGQSLGIPLQWGGPYLGLMAVRRQYMRKMPGRIVGQTVDREGRRCHVLTLQAREQHIRREKATSNICSNQSLMALWATVYLSLLGAGGLRQVNKICRDGAHYLHEGLLSTGNFSAAFPGKPFLKEFALRPKVGMDLAILQRRLSDAGFFAPHITEEGYASFCVTEKRGRGELDALIALCGTTTD